MKRTPAALLLTLCWMVQALAGPELLPFEDGVSDAGFSLPDLQDRPHALADYRGKVVLVNFWATWCPSCIHEMPDLEQLAKTLEDEPFEILTVNVGEQKFRVWKFLRLVGFELPVLLDSRKEVFTAWGLTVLPTSFLLDRDGRVRYRVQAAPQWDSEATLTTIRRLLADVEHTP